MQFEWLMGCSNAVRWSQKTTDYSARGKVHGVLYFVVQKIMKQLRQHIVVG